MKIALIRHPAVSIEPGICYGRLDVGLASSATQQIASLLAGPRLEGGTRVWTSPARRCQALAEAIAVSLAVPMNIDPRLQELDFGEWEGRPWNAIARADLDHWAAAPARFAPSGGESGAELIARIFHFHASLCRDRQNCIVVSHGGPLKVLAALLLGTPVDLLAPAPPLGSVRIFTCKAL